MPSVRVSNDKRGYVHVCLVDPPTGRRKRPRVLYWFRSPPGIKVGREPFDADIRKALEEHYPDLKFDWQKLEAASLQPIEADSWTKQRRPARSATIDPTRNTLANDEIPELPTGDDAQPETLGEPDLIGESQPIAALPAVETEPSAVGIEPSSEGSRGAMASPESGTPSGRRRRGGRHRRRRREASPGAEPSSAEPARHESSGPPGELVNDPESRPERDEPPS